MSEHMIRLNRPLLDTIKHDPNLSEAAKNLFGDLCSNDHWTHEAAERFAELIRNNYVYIDGFPASFSVRADRRSRWTRFRDKIRAGLKGARA